jgi:nitrogen fixation protein FixH
MSCCGVFIMPYDATETAAMSVRAARPITGRFVLITFMAFFGVIAAVNAVMMTLAIRTMPGLDVKNGYVASQAMNGEFDAMQKQAERGWAVDAVVGLKAGQAPVSVRFMDRSKVPVQGLEVHARLAHLALTRADHAATLIEIYPGRYAADVPDIQPGGWTLVIEASRNGERVFISRNRVVLTEAQP